MSYETILYEKQEGIGFVTLNRPESLNALSRKLIQELGAALDEIEADTDVKVVILTGGPKCFCAGADIKERAASSGPPPSQTQVYFYHLRAHKFFNRIEEFQKPIIAAMSGVAVGGGCELSLVCDLRIASETVKIGVPEVKIGAIPAAGGTQRLPRLIGVGRAKEMLYTGGSVDAAEALRIGLVNRVVPVDKLMDEAKALANKLTAMPPLPIKFAKRCVNAGMQMDLASGLDYEAHCMALLAFSEDRIEGFKAFAEKRKPVYKGR
jgi:enoyl-CoA hydratase